MTTENRTNRLRYGELEQLPQKIGEAKQQKPLRINDAVLAMIGTDAYLCRVEYVDEHGDAWGSVAYSYRNLSVQQCRRIGRYERFLWFFWRLVKLDATAPGAE